MLRLVRVTYTKFWWNEIESLATRNFAINAQFYMYFYKKESLPIFLSNVKISIWTFLFYKKNVFFKISKGCYFLLGVRTDIIFNLFWDI